MISEIKLKQYNAHISALNYCYKYLIHHLNPRIINLFLCVAVLFLLFAMPNDDNGLGGFWQANTPGSVPENLPVLVVFMIPISLLGMPNALYFDGNNIISFLKSFND